MKELLMQRKIKFIQYLIATSMFVLEHFIRMGVFALILGAIQSGDMEYYKKIIILTVLFIIYSPINFMISRLLRIRYMRDTILDVRKRAFEKIIQMSFKDFSKKSKEIYISNLINDVNVFENKFFISLLNFLINIIMYLLSLFVLLFLDYKLSVFMFLFSLLLFSFATLFGKKMTKLEQEVSTSNEAFTTNMSNTFHGVEILKLNNIEDKFLIKAKDIIGYVENKKFAANVFSDLQKNVIRILTTVVSVGVIIYLGLEFQEGLALGSAVFIFELAGSSSNYLINAFPMWNQIKASISIYDKITKIEDSVDETIQGKLAFEFSDCIKVTNLNFSYDEKVILKNASFTIKKGKKYLIKGVSGAGKSTLMNLLAMVFDQYEGEILVDGQSYKDISEKSFHSKVAFIYQNVFLFEDTIKNNIALYQDIDEEQIQYAIHVAGLDEMIEEKEEGIHTQLLENGKNLSGGQRQRLSIARAIAKKSEILFVDEGTSSLNEELGKEIEKVFLTLDHTIISISHRYYEGVTDQYDYVLEVKNGGVYTYKAAEYFGEVVTC